MRRLVRLLPTFLIGVLLGLLLVTGVGSVQTTAAQGSSFDGTNPGQSASMDAQDDVDDFFQDFDHYALKYLDSSDRTLVRKATRLLKERADTEISQATYRDRLNNFRTEHPDFYGNFFGDPFYATYDLRYTRLAKLRQRIDTFINPQNSVRNTASFYCSPYGYDPAFNGQCHGFAFAASDFFSLPSGPGFGQQDLLSAQDHDWMRKTRRDIGARLRSVDPAPREPDTSRVPIANAPTPDRSESGHPTSDAIEAVAPVESGLDVGPESTPDEISVPDRIETPEREARTAPDRVEAISRIRELVRREQNGGRLPAEERREVMSTLQHMAERQNAEQTYSRHERSDRLRQRVESQIDRDHEFTDRSPRTPSNVDRPQTEIDRSASRPTRIDRSDARSGRSSSRDRSEVDNSSDDETEK